MDDPSDLETLWDSLLSGEPGTVRAAFISLSAVERDAVILHLKRMAAEPGWHSEQQSSARAALAILEDLT